MQSNHTKAKSQRRLRDQLKSLNPEDDGLVSVSTKTLINLRHAAEGIPLKVSKVRALQSGQYHSPFRGRGMEFDEVRPYQPGDDVRTLDWRVTARTGKPHTKLFREERERSVIVWADFRYPMFFATQGSFKSVVVAKTAALLAWSALQHKDRLGALIFSEVAHKELRPRGGKAAVLHCLQQLSDASLGQLTQREPPASCNETELLQSAVQALSRLRRVSRPGSLLLLISDFRSIDEQAQSQLTALSKHNDVVLIHVYDPLEADLPPAGMYRVRDMRQSLNIDTANETARRHYRQRFNARVEYLQNVSKRNRMYYLQCATADEVVSTLQRGLGLRRQ
jgi:uncharacterized protein (DUF58 family)